MSGDGLKLELDSQKGCIWDRPLKPWPPPILDSYHLWTYVYLSIQVCHCLTTTALNAFTFELPASGCDTKGCGVRTGCSNTSHFPTSFFWMKLSSCSSFSSQRRTLSLIQIKNSVRLYHVYPEVQNGIMGSPHQISKVIHPVVPTCRSSNTAVNMQTLNFGCIWRKNGA